MIAVRGASQVPGRPGRRELSGSHFAGPRRAGRCLTRRRRLALGGNRGVERGGRVDTPGVGRRAGTFWAAGRAPELGVLDAGTVEAPELGRDALRVPIRRESITWRASVVGARSGRGLRKNGVTPCAWRAEERWSGVAAHPGRGTVETAGGVEVCPRTDARRRRGGWRGLRWGRESWLRRSGSRRHAPLRRLMTARVDRGER